MKGEIVKQIEVGDDYTRLRKVFTVRDTVMRTIRDLLIDMVEELQVREQDEFDRLATKFGYANMEAVYRDSMEITIDWIAMKISLRKHIV